MKWGNKFEKTTTYDLKRISSLNLNDSTKDFLVKVGLPEYAAPFLSFVENNNIQYEGILKLTDYFTFLEPKFDKYVVIGSDGGGNMIVIDTRDNCKIKLLDHDACFSEILMSSSIERLCASLLIYQSFIDCILEENGEDAFIDSIFNDGQLNDLKQRLTDNDIEAMGENCFWFQEIGILVANREEMRK
ncbi:SUKH-4 family immunity protein [Rhodocytophaga aerolata]|uniref:SUKH-4 family immunity protein n=1 Tax=Rhodocytophaga aerolata TaxID=455078 RepID=A0ABT8RJ42_9BACT|nr:SUKH-4 family immunity protein [Rhodocytophaga aerolata]MDO1451419.1 SUKH-4 family immunity protein [Rhodocytophaga aerolata]